VKFEDSNILNLLGETVVAVVRNASHSVQLTTANYGVALFHLTGDCCSSSHFTDIGQFDELIGATILEVDERIGESRPNLESDLRARSDEYHDVLSWHFLVFATNKGHVTVDWHNDSNGYYDGSLNFTWQEPTCVNCMQTKGFHENRKCLFLPTEWTPGPLS
jgi:hypothetical protein